MPPGCIFNYRESPSETQFIIFFSLIEEVVSGPKYQHFYVLVCSFQPQTWTLMAISILQQKTWWNSWFLKYDFKINKFIPVIDWLDIPGSQDRCTCSLNRDTEQLLLSPISAWWKNSIYPDWSSTVVGIWIRNTSGKYYDQDFLRWCQLCNGYGC